MKTLNSTLGANGLDIRVLDHVFKTYWPQFEEKFKHILEQTESHAPSKPRPKEDVLGEILENTRLMSSRIRKLEVDLDRGRMRDTFDMPMGMMQEQIIDMVNTGMPTEMIFDRFSGRIPKSMLKELIGSVERIKGKEKV